MSGEDSENKPTDCITIQNIDSKDVNIIVEKLIDNSAFSVLSYHIRPYSAEKLGFSASHLQLSVTFKKNNANSPQAVDLFIKAVPYDFAAQVDFLSDSGVFIKEAYIFNTVFPRLLENYEADKWGPICYLAKEDVIVLEDLRSKNYTLIPKFFDEFKILKAGLTTLGRYHGCSIVAEAKLNENSKSPKTLLEHFPEACKETIFTRTEKIQELINHGLNLAMVLGKSLGCNPEKMKLACELMYEIVKPSKQHRNVLCHGDLWPNNMMFDMTGSSPKCILIDFQMCRYAAFALDVLQIIYLNTTSSFREKFEKDLIKAYHTALVEMVEGNENNGSMKKVKAPTLEEVFEAVDDLRLFGVAIKSLYFPMALMDPKYLAELTKSPEDYNKFLFGDRVKVTLDYMERDSAYKAKVEEAIVELGKISEGL